MNSSRRRRPGRGSRLVASSLERDVVDVIDRHAQQVERRRQDDAGQDRIEPEQAVGDIGSVRAENDEGGMRDIDDIEHAEGDRHPDRHSGIEAAEQQAGHQGVAEQVERQIHYAGQCGHCAKSWLVAVRMALPRKRAPRGAIRSPGGPPAHAVMRSPDRLPSGLRGPGGAQRVKPSSSLFAQAMTSSLDCPECTFASIMGWMARAYTCAAMSGGAG